MIYNYNLLFMTNQVYFNSLSCTWIRRKMWRWIRKPK